MFFLLLCATEKTEFDSIKSKTYVDTIDRFSYIKPALHTTRGLTNKTAERLSRCEILTHRALMQIISPPCTT